MLGSNLNEMERVQSRESMGGTEFDEHGGLELTAAQPNNSIGGDYVEQGSPRPGGTVNKKWVAIAAITIALIALLLAILSIALIVPQVNNIQSSTSGSSTSTDSSAAMTSGLDSDSGSSNSSNTSRQLLYDESDPTVLIENYYIRNETTEYYPCDCECNTSSYGVINAGYTYEIGGYYGWEYNSGYPDLYPLADLHVSVGDKVFFTARDWTPDDLWLVTEEVFESCNFSNTTGSRQLANNNNIRGDTDTYPWLPGGYTFMVQEWHLEEYGMSCLDLLQLVPICSKSVLY